MQKYSPSWSCRRCAFAVVLAVALGEPLADPAGAEGFRNPPAGAAALGRAGGKIALADDAAAIEHNPANLVNLTNAQVQVSLTAARSEVKFTSGLTGLTDKTEDPWKLLPDVFASMPLQGNKVALGLGITTPYGQSTEWSKTGQFRYTAPYFSELRLMNVNPTLAVRLSDTVSVGVGADIYVSDIDLRQNLPWSQVTGQPAPDGLVKMQGSGTGLGYNAALTWQVTEQQRLALTYRSSVTVKYSGHFAADNVPNVVQMLVAPRTDFNTEIAFPATTALGYSIQATDKLKLEADVEWIQFSRYDTLDIDASADNPLLHSKGDPTSPVAPLSIPQDWKNSWTLGVGAEYQLLPGLALRAGYIFIQTPIPDSTLAPTLPDAHRHVVSVGLGFQHERHALDVALVQSFFRDREITNNQNPVYNGTYELAAQIVAGSYSFSF